MMKMVLEFDKVDDTGSWYESPAYQAASSRRRRSADWCAFIVECMKDEACR